MWDKIRARLKSKTYWLAMVGSVLTVLEVNSGLITQLVGSDMRPYLIAFWPVIMLFAREITTTALGEK
jgi:uncharacterized membrane protein